MVTTVKDLKIVTTQLDKGLHAYMRVDYSGRSIPASLILRKSKPKIGRWVEVPASECCTPTTTITSTTAELTCKEYVAHGSIVAMVTLWYEDCYGNEHTVYIDGPDPITFCAVSYSIAPPGVVELSKEECSLTTTTTTTSPD